MPWTGGPIFHAQQGIHCTLNVRRLEGSNGELFESLKADRYLIMVDKGNASRMSRTRRFSEIICLAMQVIKTILFTQEKKHKVGRHPSNFHLDGLAEPTH